MALIKKFQELSLWNKIAAVGSIASILGLILVFLQPQVEQQSTTTKSERHNSPNINNSGGDVEINYGNSTTLESPPKLIPKFSGEIGSGSKSNRFREFIITNDNKVVFLDIYIQKESTETDDRRDRVRLCYKMSNPQCPEDSFLLYYDCSDVDHGGAVTPCTGMNYRLNTSNKANYFFQYIQGAYYLKGFWSVRTNPGIWQGVMSTTLTPVDVQDAN